MRFNKKLTALLLVLAASNAQAAVKDKTVKVRLAVMEDGQLLHETRRQSYGFRVEVVDDSEGVKPESFKNDRPFIAAAKGERYSVRLYNPLPVRVAVNLTVDGLNSISGKPSGITDGQKWMIDPYSSITIPGWQVNGGESRRFFFTDKPKSYAKWREDETGKNLSANCGVIGAAYFWNQRELDDYYDSHPLYRYSQRPQPYSSSNAAKSLGGMSAGAPARAPRAMDEMESDFKKDKRSEEPQEQAGTGMGEHQYHPTTEVAFNFDSGMYSPAQALVIYYDFVKVHSPNPFPAADYAPQMP